jgi:hypothetical protein
MTATARPSDCHSDLTDERLSVLASFFAEVSSEVADLHDSPAGDDNWSLGCRRNARWRQRLLKKAQSGEWPWFRILKPGKRFVFAVGAVPVRFYRGRHSRPNLNTLAQDVPELHQLAIAFEGVESPYSSLHYRFAIETGLLGEPVAVVFAALAREDGAVVCHWPIPFEISFESPSGLVDNTHGVVDVPPPVVIGKDQPQIGTADGA